MALVANEKAEFAFTSTGAVNGPVDPAIPPVLAGLGDPMVTADGSPVLQTSLSLSVPSFAQATGATGPGVAAGPFAGWMPGATFTKADGTSILLTGDKSTPVSVTWPGPQGATLVGAVTAEVKTGGSDYVEAK